MPRVLEKTKFNMGADRSCGKCGKEIKPKDKYLIWSFRYGGTYFRCTDCPRPRPSELTQSKLGDVYAAIEEAEDALAGTTTGEEIVELVTNAGEAVQQVADEYHEAAEPFGESGENQERGDELEGFADELQNFELDDEIEAEEECGDCEGTGEIGEGDDAKKCAQCEGEGKLERDEAEVEDELQAGRDAAMEVLGTCSAVTCRVQPRSGMERHPLDRPVFVPDCLLERAADIEMQVEDWLIDRIPVRDIARKVQEFEPERPLALIEASVLKTRRRMAGEKEDNV